MKKFNICNKTADTSLCFAEHEQRTLYGALVVTLAMLLRLIKYRFIIIIIILTPIIPEIDINTVIDNVTHSQRVTRSGVVFPSNKATVYTYIYARHKYYLELSHMAGAVNSIIIIRWWYRPKYLVAASTALLTAPIWLMAYWYHGIDSLDLSDIVRHTQSA